MASPHPITGQSLLLFLILSVPAGAEAPESRKYQGAAWRDAVTYRMPDDANTRNRVTRSADWLKQHLVALTRPEDAGPIRLIAWKDPTLEPTDPKLLAGYAITDTLWAAKALKCFDPVASQELEQSLQCLGWPGNGLHDVLFHPLEKILHRSADEDIVHGFSLGRFPTTNARTVDVRVLRQKSDARYDVGHPLHFAEHAVYRALYDFWQGRTAEARRSILSVVEENLTGVAPDLIFWDRQTRILVDFVNRQDWLAFHDGRRPVCRHYTFKLGVLLYAIRLLGMEQEIGPPMAGMKERLWSAQTESGGLAHFVDVRSNGPSTTGRQPTGEATAIAILTEVVEANPPVDVNGAGGGNCFDIDGTRTGTVQTSPRFCRGCAKTIPVLFTGSKSSLTSGGERGGKGRQVCRDRPVARREGRRRLGETRALRPDRTRRPVNAARRPDRPSVARLE